MLKINQFLSYLQIEIPLPENVKIRNTYRNTPCRGHPKGENRPWHERYVMLDYLTTTAARLMAFEMLICHKSGNDMPCIVKTKRCG